VVDLKNYICKVPFEMLEIHDESYFLCCASWLKKYLPKNQPMKDVWNSDEAKDIRKSIIDGSYQHCDKKQCPYLSQLTNLNKNILGPIKTRSEMEPDFLKNYNLQTGEMSQGPKTVHMSFDRTCNYKCPSCRIEMIVANTGKIEKINSTIEEMETLYSNSIETIYCSGTADPFASVSYRNFLRNFNPKKYPNLKHIHLHTNASLWNKEMWDSMPNIHKYVNSCEISIDAGTQYTYENVTRLGGKWDNLINNLKFISTINSLQSVKCSFVAQQSNYNEMEIFLNLIYSIFKNKTRVFFGRITNWGTFSGGHFKLIDIGDVNHPEHQLFLKEFNKVATNPYVFHNMYELIDLKKSLI
jgi:hypothetical protein